VHDAVGECSSNALYKILVDIRPDVIFVEMPPSLFSKYYLGESNSKLETNAVKMYMKDFNAVTFPVDTDDIPSATFFREYKNAMEQVLGLEDIIGEDFRTLVGNKKHYTSIHGFRFLNSDYYLQFTDAIEVATEKALEKINDERLSLAYKKWNELTDRREDEMLQNIYDYSREHNYNNAVFLLGAGHRKSTKEKIEEYRVNRLPKLNWVIYGD